MPTDPIDAEFEDVAHTTPTPAPHVATKAHRAAHALADLFDLGGDAAAAGATVAGALSPDAGQRATEAAAVARAGADVVRTGADAVATVVAATRAAASPFQASLAKWMAKARAAHLIGDAAPPRGVHRGPRRVVTVVQRGTK